MYTSTLRKMQHQREKRIAEVYKCYSEGSNVTFLDANLDFSDSYTRKLVLILKKELNGEYFFICEQKNNSQICIMKLVYDKRVKLIQVSSKKFERNRHTFELWIDEAKANAKRYRY